MPNLITLGETMVVFDPTVNGPIRYVDQFRKRFGGAESNVALGLSRLGHQVGWVSRVGQDELGKYLVQAIRGEGVDTSCVTYDSEAPTALYIKERIRDGHSQVYYYRHQSATSRLRVADIDWDYLKSAKIIHLTGITPFLSESCLDVVHEVIRFAKNNSILISFDPNIRKKIMASYGMEDAITLLRTLAKQADIVMPGIDEAELLFGTSDYKTITDELFDAGVTHVAIKNGDKGVYYASRNGKSGIKESFSVERVVDPIGAGDGFAAGVLSGLLDGKPLEDSVEIGAVIGAMVVTVAGDIEGLPDKQEIENFLKDEQDVVR